MVWLRTCLCRCVNLAVAFAPQPAARPLAAMPIRTAATAAQGKPVAVAPSTNGDTTKDATPQFDLSAFNQIVTQIVNESVAPVPAPHAQVIKLPPKPATAPEDPLPELSSPLPAAPTRPVDTAVSSRKPDTRGSAASTNEKAAQPSAAVVDINVVDINVVDINIVPIPVPSKLRLPSFTGEGSADQNLVKPTTLSGGEESAASILQPKPLLEVKIHLDQSSEEGIQQGAEDTDPGARRTLRTTSVQQAPTAPVGSVNVPEQTPELPASNSAPPPTSPVSSPPPPVYIGNTKPEPQPASAPMREEPMADQAKTQSPIRSLALEFTPDGAGDIRVRLAERSGDVHISLHGTDPSLAGRVREGVSDLVGYLSKAGYDAEAWTPGRERQSQRQQSDQRPSLRKSAGGADAADFNGLLQQPIQEIS